MEKRKKPELLAPAGSPEALEAAVAAGADAVYLGTPDFNARIGAQNFTPAALEEGAALCHARGAAVHVAMNTLVWDREMPRFLAAAYEALSRGADALIVADYGAARLLRRHFPEAALHASTQLSVHNLAGVNKMAEDGFSRVVVARELDRKNLETICRNAPAEIEMFVHGALCVSHSGQCLASALIGGRSGNRGLCAQPCRLPARDGTYPLSLRDSCLAGHLREICELGVSSLKIEGRMKPASYVSGVVGIYRRLLDEERDATPEEIRELAAIFSRSGFTDSYFCGRILPDRNHRDMLGVRTQEDKEKSRAFRASEAGEEKPALPSESEKEKRPVRLTVCLAAGEPSRLTMTAADGRSVTVSGEVPERALRAPLSEADVRRSLSRLGDSPFAAQEITVELQSGVILRVSALNALRRAAVQAMEALLEKQETEEKKAEVVAPLKRKEDTLTKKETAACPAGQMIPPLAAGSGGRVDLENLKAELIIKGNTENFKNSENKKHKSGIVSARFSSREQLAGLGSAASCFDLIYLPLWQFSGELGAEGCVLPPVVFDDEWDALRRRLSEVCRLGARHALVANVGQVSAVREAGLIPHGDFRLNTANSFSAVCWQAELAEVILSPELTVPMARDIPGEKSVIVYGRLPMMLLEKCVIRDLVGCGRCGKEPAFLEDRIGKRFPLLREASHRNLLLNCVPVWMADREDDLRLIGGGRHFLFTIETPQQVRRVIEAYRHGDAPAGAVRRIRP